MLYYFQLYMHHNYCFRCKQHSYVAWDAALAARSFIVNSEKDHGGCDFGVLLYLLTQSLYVFFT